MLNSQWSLRGNYFSADGTSSAASAGAVLGAALRAASAAALHSLLLSLTGLEAESSAALAQAPAAAAAASASLAREFRLAARCASHSGARAAFHHTSRCAIRKLHQRPHKSSWMYARGREALESATITRWRSAFKSSATTSKLGVGVQHASNRKER